MADTVEGYVEKIVFRNEDNGYTVLSLNTEDEELTCVGSFPFIGEGEYMKMTGNYMDHPMYGQQFQVKDFEAKNPDDIIAVERYLASGAIKGIGAALAGRIIKRFGEDSFRMIEEEPERLSEVKGISEKKAREIAEQFYDKREQRSAMIFLQQYGISTNLAVKIYKQYGNSLHEILNKNPYKLAEDIAGVGFKMADDIAKKSGMSSDCEFRIKAGLLYVLMQAARNGHVFLPENELYNQTLNLLLLEEADIDKNLMDMVIDKQIVIKETNGEKCIYTSSFYYMELNSARMLCDLNLKYELSLDEMKKQIHTLEQSLEIELDEMQRMAVMEAARSGLLIVTGGPGTGKTTTINTIIKLFEGEGLDILLAAPTGRAAKRMSETTGYEAQTIHRLLELTGGADQEEGKNHFERNECNPLEADAIIIDEMSMVDIQLMHSLLKAITVGTRLILVGDVNQLPSVGPGNVLKDLIHSHCFNVVRLTKIFRQAAESDIIVNAHKINDGEQITWDNKSKDFFLLQRTDVNLIISNIITLIREKLPKYVNTTPYDIQVLTPMRKGELGVERLNRILQQYLNPPELNKKEKELPQGILREGDKVMQIKNNYQLVWEQKNQRGLVYETGTGVYNGDMGVVHEVNLFAETLTVEFDECRYMEYTFSQCEELELAYAITIHKSQGSEYPAVVMPILTGPKMLFSRNLLYTAVTRAKSCVTIVGSKQMLQTMISNASEQKRYSALSIRIKECC